MPRGLGILALAALLLAGPGGCADPAEEPGLAAHLAAAEASGRPVPPNLAEILTAPGLAFGIEWTYWHCEETGALLEAVPAKNSWWWVVEPDDVSRCELRRIDEERFDELDPRP